MQHLNLQVVEEILEGQISTNPHRFEAANGIVFSVNVMDEEVMDYLAGHGVEWYKLVSGIYYTETIMSIPEFEQLDYILYVLPVA